jgi:hypothetical protein
VNKEIAYWLDTKSADTLLIGVTDGVLTWDNAANDFAWSETTPLPPALKGKFSAEPEWVDLTAYRGDAIKRDANFIELAAGFAAAIRGMPKDDLVSQEVKQQRQALTLAWSAAAALLLLAGAAGRQWKTALVNERAAFEQRNRAVAAVHEVLIIVEALARDGKLSAEQQDRLQQLRDTLAKLSPERTGTR